MCTEELFVSVMCARVGLLVGERLAAVSGTLALATAAVRTLARDTRCNVRSGNTGSSEVLEALTATLATTKEEGVLAAWGNHCELVERDALTSGAENALASTAREAKSANAESGQLNAANVVKDITDNDCDGGLHLGEVHPACLALHERRDAAQRDGGTVAAALHKASVHKLVELAGRACSQILVELDQQLDVRVARQRVLAHGALLLLHSG